MLQGEPIALTRLDARGLGALPSNFCAFFPQRSHHPPEEAPPNAPNLTAQLPSISHQALEKHKRKPEALRGWCIYWVVIALYTVGAQIGDRFIFWLPMYCEAKVAFVTYLWHPRTQGALYIYETFVSPFLAKHEPDIDRHIDETRASVGDVVVRNSRGAVDFVRNKMTNLLMSVPQANGGGSTGEARYMGARNATEAAATAYTRVPPKPRSD